MSDKKTAIVTGASRGTGAGLVQASLKEGYTHREQLGAAPGRRKLDRRF